MRTATVCLFGRYMHEQEERLAKVDEEFKDCGPFRLGAFEGTTGIPFSSIEEMITAVGAKVANAATFFAMQSDLSSFKVAEKSMSFESMGGVGGVPDAASVVIHPSRRKTKRAVIIVPHWSAQDGAYDSMGQALAMLGHSTFILTLPHHNARSASPVRQIANDFLNADLGVAIRSVRQSVSDVRSIVTWLNANGTTEVHLIGVSLGSSVASLVAAFDPRLASTSLFLTAGDFAEVVWKGRATSHIQSALDRHMELAQLKKIWAIISPSSFLDEFRKVDARLLIVTGRRDKVVPFDLARAFADELKKAGVKLDWRVLPCGHYTLASFPYSWISLAFAARFIHRR